jgi:serine/threonine-protein kinase
MTGTALRAVIADDNPLICKGVFTTLREGGIEVLGTAPDATTLLELVATTDPDIAVVDIVMPDRTEGIEAAERIRSDYPRTKVLLLSGWVYTDQLMDLVAGDDGAAGLGYLLKDRVTDLEEFIRHVRRVARGGTAIDPDLVARMAEQARRARQREGLHSLTPRELDVLRRMAEGLSNKGIAKREHLVVRTVEDHISHIFGKLGIPPEPTEHRRVLAVLKYLRDSRDT